VRHDGSRGPSWSVVQWWHLLCASPLSMNANTSLISGRARRLDARLFVAMGVTVQLADAQTPGGLAFSAFQSVGSYLNLYIGATRTSTSPPWGWSWIDGTNNSNIECGSIG
jgi:hypothetical protein